MGEIVLDLLCHADFSGRIRPSREDIGFPAFSAEIAKLRAQNPAGTLLLDAGDAFSTNYWPGLPLVGAMIRSKTDVMTLGNHEFDRGPAFLDSCISACPFPILCANVRRKADGAPVPGTKPWVLLERCGIRIGVLGLTTEYTPYMVEKSAFAPFEMTSAAEAAARHIPAMRAAGADNFPVQLIVNNASCEETKEELASYARRATIEILASLDYCKELEYSSLAGKTVFDTAPDSACAAHLRAVADDLLLSTIPTSLTPFPRRELVTWLRCWQRRELARRLALADTEACDG